jgi:hypothetical protein
MRACLSTKYFDRESDYILFVWRSNSFYKPCVLQIHLPERVVRPAEGNMLAARRCDRFTFTAAGHLPALWGDGLMKKLQGTVLLVSLMAGAGLLVSGLPALASVTEECRQEAQDYGIPPEQLQDYVSGCVSSRGGDYAQEPAMPDYLAPPEGEVGNDAGMGSDYAQEPAMPDYNAPLEGEAGNGAGMDGDYVTQ